MGDLTDEERLPAIGSLTDHARPPVRVGVIGCGYWGPHLIRNLHEIAESELLAVADVRPERLHYVGARYPGVRCFADHRELLATEVDAGSVASPIHTHYALAREAMRAARQVLVEKPLAASVIDAAHLGALAHGDDRALRATLT